ncbi:MAG: hypothetical protein ACTHJQ_09485 [Rhizobiaceae bacterium]
MPGEHRPNADYRGLALWAFCFVLCAATVYGAIIWFIFWLVG